MADEQNAIASIADAVPAGIDLSALAPLIEAIAKMDDEDVNYIFAKCMGVCSRRENESTSWAPIWNKTAGCPQFDDIDMMTMLTITANVLQGALSGFFTAALSR